MPPISPARRSKEATTLDDAVRFFVFPAGDETGAVLLEGSWSMQGRVTKAQGVRGEHRGQRVTRSWIFEPACSGGPCRKVVLSRERSRHRIDRVVLRESGRGRYEGNGRFYVPLRCRSKVYPHGGIAYETIRLSISHTQPTERK